MVCSASASSSLVLTPGRASSMTAASVPATRPPAARIASSSSGLFSSMSLPRQRASRPRTPVRPPLIASLSSLCAQRLGHPVGDLLDGADGLDADEPIAVVVQKWSGLAAVDLLTAADDVLGVVVATPAHQPA